MAASRAHVQYWSARSGIVLSARSAPTWISATSAANLRGEIGSTPKNLRVRQLDAHAERGLGSSKQKWVCVFLTWPCREVGIRGMNRRYGSGYGSGV